MGGLEKPTEELYSPRAGTTSHRVSCAWTSRYARPGRRRPPSPLKLEPLRAGLLGGSLVGIKNRDYWRYEIERESAIGQRRQRIFI